MKPILFNTEMARAILDGRKTVTRRLVKPQPDSRHQSPLGYCVSSTGSNTDIGKYGWGINEYGGHIQYAKPTFQIGDILYVRETFCSNYFDECIARLRNGNRNAYKADYNKDVVGDVVPEPKWKPSIHMPKEAARIFLKVTDVRVERLQDITEEQIIKEGISPYDDICQDERWEPTYNDPDSGGSPNLKQGFEILWDSTVKEDWQKFASNPWVFVYEFERCEKPEGWC